MRKLILTLSILLILVSALATPATAQTFTTLYPAKMICGYVPGNVPTFGGAVPFPAGRSLRQLLEPGEYATVVNLFHNQVQTDSLQIWALMEEQRPTLIRNVDGLAPFQAVDIGCRDLVSALGGTTAGFFFEGWLVIASTSPTLSVKSVHTMDTQNAAFTNQQWQVNAAGTLLAPQQIINSPANPFGVFIPAGQATPPTLLQAPGIPGQVAISASGGVGVGSSIDVEDVDPVTLASPLAGEELTDLMLSVPPFLDGR